MAHEGAGADLTSLRLVMDSMLEGFALLSPDFTILEVNREALQIDERSREQLIGRSHWDAYPGSEDSELGRVYKQAMDERRPVSLEHRYVWEDGRSAWLEMRAFPVENGCLAVFFRDISERRDDLERLERSEQRFKAAVAAIEGILWTNDADGRMSGEQVGWASLTGQSYEEYQGYGWSAAVHPDDAKPTIRAWEAAVAAKAPFEFEHRLRRHDGEWRICAVRAIPLLDADGRVQEWVGVHRDMTDTRANAFRLQQLAETIDAVFYVREIDEGRIAYVSRAYEDIWGRTREELYGNELSFLESIHPEDRARVEQAVTQQNSGICVDIEYRLLLEDGTERVVVDRPFAVKDPVSGGCRVVGLATDVTESRRAQDLLARNAETFGHLVASNPFGLHVVDQDFRLLQISQGAQKVFADIDPLLGRDFGELMRIIWAEPFASEAIATFRNTLATGEPYVSHATTERRENTGEVESYDWRIERIVLPNGKFGVVCYFYDLSERKAFEAELTQALADKDLLAREIDHRVKNSLTVVASLLSMQRGASSSDETRAALDEAMTRVMAVARVHESLHRSDELGIVAFGEYLDQLCRDLSGSMGRPDVEMHCSCENVDLPAHQAMALALIANELVTNAYKHGCAAGASRISVELSQDQGTICLTISDNGSGMPDVPLAGSPSLGLKMVKAMTRQLQADAEFPEPRQPAKFVFCLPAD